LSLLTLIGLRERRRFNARTNAIMASRPPSPIIR
jgi:hypothetical protein